MIVPPADQIRLSHILADDLQPRIEWAYALEQAVAAGGDHSTHTTPLTGSEHAQLSPDGYATVQEIADLSAVPDSWMQLTGSGGINPDSSFMTITFGVSGSNGSDIELDGDSQRIRILTDGRYSVQMIGEWSEPTADGLTTMACLGVTGALGAVTQTSVWVPFALGAMPGGPVAFDNITTPPLSFVAGDAFHVVAGFYSASGTDTVGGVVVVYIARVA